MKLSIAYRGWLFLVDTKINTSFCYYFHHSPNGRFRPTNGRNDLLNEIVQNKKAESLNFQQGIINRFITKGMFGINEAEALGIRGWLAQIIEIQ